MTERMQAYRKRMEEKGLVQVRIWVEKEDEEFVKFFGKFCRGERTKKEKQRYGRPSNPAQIRIAKAVATANGLPAPEHLYPYHASLAAWISRYRCGRKL